MVVIAAAKIPQAVAVAADISIERKTKCRGF